MRLSILPVILEHGTLALDCVKRPCVYDALKLTNLHLHLHLHLDSVSIVLYVFAVIWRIQ